MKRFPNVRVIGAHLGGWTVWDEAVRQLCDIDNLYVDCSSSLFAMSPERAAEIINIYTPDRVFTEPIIPCGTRRGNKAL